MQKLSTAIGNYSGSADAYPIAIDLAKLTGLLRIHFAQEDRSLYPEMMASSSNEVAATAATFQREMGDIGPIFEKFVERWGTSAAIAAAFATFRIEASVLFARLADRIRRENEELYRLADEMHQPQQPRDA